MSVKNAEKEPASTKNEEIEKKPVIPTKSSMEILSELFSTFDAEPPLIIKKEKTESSGKKHKKKKHKHKEKKDKKHKKSKKKKKTEGESSSSSSDESKPMMDLAEILIKQEKDSSAKKIKIEGTGLALKVEDFKKEELKIKKEKSPEKKPKISSDSASKPKIKIKNLQDSLILQSLQTEKENGERSDSEESGEKKHKKSHKHKRKHSKRSSTRSPEREKKQKKVEDLRNKLKERERSRERRERDFYRGSHRYEHRSRDRSRERHRSREKHRNDDHKSNRKLDNPFYRDKHRDDKWSVREKYRDDKIDRHRRDFRDEDSSSRFDKKKLLEIARKNAIAMMKSGSLPGALTLGPQAQEKVIAAIKSGGKTIEELTDFCKTLSKKEEMGELSSLSEKDDSDSDNDKPFHHPFQLKERPLSIVMNIKNSIPLPIKSNLERTTELRMQFPVSSGQQHRKDEEWTPVSLPSKKSEEKPPPPPITTTTNNETPVTKEVIPTEPPVVPAPPNAPPGPQAFPTPVLKPAVDIGSIVSQRLNAMKRLQENPNDVQALSQMYKSNQEMQSWASSKQQLGQFTGTTGAQILSQSELASGYQAWAKKDQLQTAAPVSGGMGMHLLQKMGWKPGEGLGKEKTGTLEPLLLEVKLDKKGLVSNEEQPNKRGKKIKGSGGGGGGGSVKNLQGKHPVSMLGEYASKKKLGAPQYILEFECGPDHKKNFLFKVILNGIEYKPNVASNNKKEAKAAAASICLQNIGLLPITTTAMQHLQPPVPHLQPPVPHLQPPVPHLQPPPPHLQAPPMSM